MADKLYQSVKHIRSEPADEHVLAEPPGHW